MAPMVSTAGAAAAFVAQAHERGLSRAGIMIEVPSKSGDLRRQIDGRRVSRGA